MSAQLVLEHPVTTTRARYGSAFGARSLLLAFSIAVGLIGCSDSSPLAPDGSTIELAANPTQLGVDGDTAVLTAFVYESDGRRVDNGTIVTFIASSGGFCQPESTSQQGAPAGRCDSGIVSASTRDGIAKAVYSSGSTPGDVTITARSGVITKAATLTLTALVAPADAKVVADAEPDTIAVGQTSRITAFLSTATGPVQNGTRVVFSSADSAVLDPIATTHDGFAQTTVMGRRAGALAVLIVSGTVRDSAVVIVR